MIPTTTTLDVRGDSRRRLALIALGAVLGLGVWTNAAGAADTVVTLQVGASAGDVNEVNAVLTTNAAAIWLGNGGSTTSSSTGLRFSPVVIPPGSVITSAYLQVYSTQNQWISYAFAIAADASGDSPAFTASSRPSQRTRTTNTVSHSDNVSWVANTWYALEDIKAVVQEVVDRPDWLSGHSLSIILTGAGSGAYGRKFVSSFDGNAATAPRLVVSYAGAAVTPPPTATMSAAPSTIASGQASLLTWSTSNATTVSIDQGIGIVAPSGSIAVAPTATTAYVLTATNSGGPATSAALVTVTAAAQPPTATFSVSPSTVVPGGSATLSWSTTNASSVTIDQGIGVVPASGTRAVSPSTTTTFTLTATNPDGSTARSSTLAVSGSAGTFTTQISAAADDVNEVNSTLTANESTLWLGNGGSTTSSYTGLRFTAVAIPPRSSIISAYLQVYSARNQWISYAFGIAGDASGNSPAFTATSLPSQRTRTTSAATHSDNVNWAANTWYALDDMKGIVQEVVSRADWLSGNSLSIILTGAGTGAYGRKFVSSVDGNPATAPRLVVSYTTTGGAPPPTATLTAFPSTIAAGQAALLTWSTSNATTVTIDQGIGTVASSGSIAVAPATTTTYTLTATSSSGPITAAALVSVTSLPPPPTATLSVSPSTVAPGVSSTLSWSTANALSASIDQGIGAVSPSGSITVSPAATTTYTITATGPSSAVTQSATLTVTAAAGSAAHFAIGPGFTDVISHQLIRTGADLLYVFAARQPSSPTLAAYWTAGSGLPASGSAFGASAQIALPAVPLSVSPAYDGASTVHVLANLQNGSVVDVPFDLTSNTFRPAKVIATGTATVSGDYIGTSGVTSMVDQVGRLQVAYWTSANQIIHAVYGYDAATNVLTQVSAPVRVDTGGSARHPSLAVSPLDNSVTVAWVSLATTPRHILARVRSASGTWGVVEAVSNSSVDVWTSSSGGLDIDQGPSLLVTGDGFRHVVYIENYDSSGDYGSVHYASFNGGAWTDQELVATYSHDPALAVNGAGQLYVIGHGHPNDAALACKSADDICVSQRNSDGSWGAPTIFAQHTAGSSFDSSPSVKWSVMGWNRPETIEFLFFQTPYTTPVVFYGRLP